MENVSLGMSEGLLTVDQRQHIGGGVLLYLEGEEGSRCGEETVGVVDHDLAVPRDAECT